MSQKKSPRSKASRREMLAGCAGWATVTFVPRHVLGGPGFTAPSDIRGSASIGIGGPVSRLSKKTVASFIPHVIETASAISARLGHRGRPVN